MMSWLKKYIRSWIVTLVRTSELPKMEILEIWIYRQWIDDLVYELFWSDLSMKYKRDIKWYWSIGILIIVVCGEFLLGIMAFNVKSWKGEILLRMNNSNYSCSQFLCKNLHDCKIWWLCEIRLLNDFEMHIWELLLWICLNDVMVMNNIMNGKKDINSNRYISFIWEILGLDDKS